jgi:hypothetical protein
LHGLIRVLLFKRFESSIFAFQETVRLLLKIHNCRGGNPVLLGLCIPDQPNHSFQPYAVFIEDTNSRTEGRCSGLFWKEAMKYDSYQR